MLLYLDFYYVSTQWQLSIVFFEDNSVTVAHEMHRRNQIVTKNINIFGSIQWTGDHTQYSSILRRYHTHTMTSPTPNFTDGVMYCGSLIACEHLSFFLSNKMYLNWYNSINVYTIFSTLWYWKLALWLTEDNCTSILDMIVIFSNV